MPTSTSVTTPQRNALCLMAHALNLSNLTSLDQVLANSAETDKALIAFERLVGQHLYTNDERDAESAYLTPEQQAALGVMNLAIQAWKDSGLMEMAIGTDRDIERAVSVTTDTLDSAADQHALPL